MCNCCDTYTCRFRARLSDAPTDYWVDKCGGYHKISEMPTPYLTNVLRLIHRKRIWSNVGWERCTVLILEAVTRLERVHQPELYDAFLLCLPCRRRDLTKTTPTVRIHCQQHRCKTKAKPTKSNQSKTKSKRTKALKLKKKLKQLVLDFNGLY